MNSHLKYISTKQMQDGERKEEEFRKKGWKPDIKSIFKFGSGASENKTSSILGKRANQEKQEVEDFEVLQELSVKK